MRAPRRRVWRLTKSGEINDNPVILKQRAEVFASGATAAGPSTLVVTRDTEGLRHYAIMPATSRIDSAALSLAHCVAARLNPLDEAPDLSFGPVVGHLRWRRTHASIRATQAGADIAEVSRILGDVMPDGSWVGAVIRRPGMFERRRWLNWLSYRMGTRRPTHHSTSEDAVVTTIWAGSSSKDDTRAVLESLAAGLPGFDLGTKVAFPSRWRWTILASLAAAMMVAPWIIGLLPWWLSLPPAAGTLALGVLAGARLLPTRDARVQRGLGTSRLPAPRRRTIPPRRPKRIHTEHIDTETHFEGGSYPLRREALILGPELPASIVAPHSGALSGASTTRERQVPLAMTRPIGPMIGTTNDGQKVFLSARDSAAGIACVGRPGSGKALALDARIPVPVSAKFPTGWARNDELSVGDKVFAADGTITEVRGFSDVFSGEVYELTFSDGQKVKADVGHLWTVSTRAGRASQSARVEARRSLLSAEAAQRADRLREMAATLEPGTFASVPNLAEMLGVSSAAVSTFLSASGIGGQEQLVEILPVRTIPFPTMSKRYRAKDIAAIRRAQRPDPRRKPWPPGAIRRLEGLSDALLTQDEIARVVCGNGAGDEDMNLVKGWVKRSGARAQEVRTMVTRKCAPTRRRLMVYPAAETLYAYAKHIESRASRAEPLHRVVDTATIVEQLRMGDGRARFAVDASEPVDGPEVELPIDPYVLGVWLGDGISRTGQVVAGRQDAHELRSLLADAWADDVRIRHVEANDYYVLRPKGLQTKLRENGLLLNKHIPAAYMRASRSQRLALLQGIMDTDGHVTQQGRAELGLADRALLEQVKELVESLGIIVGPVTSSPSSYTKRCPQTGEVTHHEGAGKHSITFTPALTVFRLTRKASRRSKLSHRARRRYVVAAERIGHEPVRCISVTHPSSTFLVEGFIPTHNSVLLSNVFTWSMMERVNPSGMPGSPGRNNTLVNFETKLDGARTTLQWAHAVGDRVLLIEVANPASHAIDLFAVPGSVEERALHFTNALQYAFADGSIRDESFRTLKVVLTGGLVVDDDMVADIEGVAAGRSPIYYASVLMGRLGDEAGKQLATAIHAEHEKAQAAGHIASDYSVAWESLALLYGPTVTPSQRAGFQRAPGNKLDQLLALEHYFAPARKKVTWSQILTGHRAVVILTGVDSAGHIMESNMEQLMSSLLMFSLRYNIERTCSGWEGQDRWVSIFADELKELAGSTPDIITWLRNKGRSYGVRPHFATQYPEQLNMDVRDALLSFSTLIAFTQGTPRIARELVEDFAGDGTDWTVGDVLDLPPYHAIVRANVNYKRQSPFPFRSAYFLDEHTKQPLVEQFRAAQEPSA